MAPDLALGDPDLLELEGLDRELPLLLLLVLDLGADPAGGGPGGLPAARVVAR